MRKIIMISLLSLSAISFAGQFFDVTGTSSSMTIALNIPTHMTYQSAGIKMSGAYTLTSQGNECVMNNKGYCIFQLGRNTPKTLSISGSGNQVMATICLNANGPLSCQDVSYNLAGGDITYTDYVYVVQPTSVQLCLADSEGNLSSCQDSGATGLVGAQSIVFDTTAQYAYISTIGSGSAPGTGGITSCTVNPTTKLLSACSSTSLGILSNLPQQLAYLVDGGTQYIYMAARPYNASFGATVYRCLVNAGSVSTCTEPANDLDSSLNITGIAINPGSTIYAYVVDNSGFQLENCVVDTAANTLFRSSTISTLANPEFVSINPGETGVYLPFYLNPIRFYPISSGQVVTIGSSLAGSSFNHPKQAITNSTGTFAFVTNNGDNTVSVCTINSLNNNFLSCQVSSEVFSGPIGIAALPY